MKMNPMMMMMLMQGMGNSGSSNPMMAMMPMLMGMGNDNDDRDDDGLDPMMMMMLMQQMQGPQGKPAIDPMMMMMLMGDECEFTHPVAMLISMVQKKVTKAGMRNMLIKNILVQNDLMSRGAARLLELGKIEQLCNRIEVLSETDGSLSDVKLEDIV